MYWTIVYTATGKAETAQTAAKALKRVRSSAERKAATTGTPVRTTVITWKPTTRIGRMVVKALQEE